MSKTRKLLTWLQKIQQAHKHIAEAKWIVHRALVNDQDIHDKNKALITRYRTFLRCADAAMKTTKHLQQHQDLGLSQKC